MQHPNHADSATEERRLTHPSSATAGMVSGTPAVVPVRLSQKRTAGRSLARKDDSDDHDDPFRSDDLGRAFMVLSAATDASHACIAIEWRHDPALYPASASGARLLMASRARTASASRDSASAVASPHAICDRPSHVWAYAAPSRLVSASAPTSARSAGGRRR